MTLSTPVPPTAHARRYSCLSLASLSPHIAAATYTPVVTSRCSNLLISRRCAFHIFMHDRCRQSSRNRLPRLAHFAHLSRRNSNFHRAGASVTTTSLLTPLFQTSTALCLTHFHCRSRRIALRSLATLVADVAWRVFTTLFADLLTKDSADHHCSKMPVVSSADGDVSVSIWRGIRGDSLWAWWRTPPVYPRIAAASRSGIMPARQRSTSSALFLVVALRPVGDERRRRGRTQQHLLW